MSTAEKIKDKIADAKARSYYKSWYKRLPGKILLVIIIVIIALFVYLGVSFFNNLQHLTQGDILNKESGNWITFDEYQKNQQGISALLTEDDPVLGTDEPLVYIIAYESFGCQFCKENQADIKEMMDRFGSAVRFIFKDWPTESLHKNVFEAHLAAGCAQEQDRFWEYHDILFTNQGNHQKSDLKKYAEELGLNMSQFDACLDNEKYSQEIRQDFAQGVDLGVVGTPSYIINGQLVPGAIPFELWEQIIAFIIQQEG